MTTINRSQEPLRTLYYEGLSQISGPIVVVEGISDVAYDEAIELSLADGGLRHGRVLQASENAAVIEVFGGTAGLGTSGPRVRFTGSPLRVPVSRQMLGRVFDGLAQPIDGIAPPVAEALRDINSAPINPTRRVYPQNVIVTGVSVIDGMNTLVRGQKLPIFSGSGLPHNQLAAQIARQAQIRDSDEGFAVIFVALGVRHDDAEFFRRAFKRAAPWATRRCTSIWRTIRPWSGSSRRGRR